MTIDADNLQEGGTGSESLQWTAKVRNAASSAFPPDRLLPDRQPAYMASWIYVFGVLTVVSLVWVILTGSRARHHGAELVACVGTLDTS